MIRQEEIKQLQDVLGPAQTVGILVSENPNLDTMAAALSLYLALSLGQKKVSISCKSEPVVGISSLVGIDKVERQLSLGGSDMTVSLPYKQGTIEKISYNIEGDRINLVIKAGASGLDFDPSEITYLKSGGSADVIFAIGIRQASMLSEFISKTYIVNIDNNGANARFGEMVFVDPSASSKSEIVSSVISSLSLPIDRDCAQNLLSGIDFATNNFQDTKTSPLAFEMAGLLLKNGAVRNSKPRRDEDFPPEAFFPPMPMSKPPLSPQFTPPTHQQPFLHQGKQDQQQQGGQGKKKQPPADWLTPKIYKGSTTV